MEKFPVFYIRGSQTLPPPLDVIEEEKLLQKLNSRITPDAQVDFITRVD